MYKFFKKKIFYLFCFISNIYTKNNDSILNLKNIDINSLKLKCLFKINENIISNFIKDNEYIYYIINNNSKIYLTKQNLINNKNIQYIYLNKINYNQSLNFKINKINNYYVFVDNNGTIYLYINNNIITVHEQLVMPIYDIPILNINNNNLIIYLFHSGDIVSKILVKNIDNDIPNIEHKIIHQWHEYNNIYYNFYKENILVQDEYLIIGSKTSNLYVYKNDILLWCKNFENKYQVFFQLININDHKYLYTFNFYNGNVILFDLNLGEEIWKYIHTELIINSYFLKEKQEFCILDNKNNLIYLNMDGKIITSINIVDKFLTNNKNYLWNKIYNFFIIQDKLILLTNKGIYILDITLNQYSYIPMIITNKNIIEYNDKYLFFYNKNKIYII